MNTNILLGLQALLASLQFVNTAIAGTHHDTTIALVIGAAVVGLQIFLQHIGNQTMPTKP